MPLRRPPLLAALSFRLGLVINELPFVAFYYLAASTVLAISQHDVTSAGGWAALALAVLAAAGLGVIVRRGLQTGPVVHAALGGAFGDGWPQDSAATAARLGACRWAASCSCRSSPAGSACRNWSTSATAR